MIDYTKLKTLIDPKHKFYDLNKHNLNNAVNIMNKLDAIGDQDFDITEIEKEAGEISQSESARIAKIIMHCHHRGFEWVEKWNDRVRTNMADVEVSEDKQAENQEQDRADVLNVLRW
jgi:hypothetical protein